MKEKIVVAYCMKYQPDARTDHNVYLLKCLDIPSAPMMVVSEQAGTGSSKNLRIGDVYESNQRWEVVDTFRDIAWLSSAEPQWVKVWKNPRPGQVVNTVDALRF